MDFKFGAAAALAATAALLAGAAAAHDDGPQPATAAGKAAGQRHQNFKQVGAAFKSALDESKKGAPDAKVIGASAQKLATLSGQMTTCLITGPNLQQLGAAREGWRCAPRRQAPDHGAPPTPPVPGAAAPASSPGR